MQVPDRKLEIKEDSLTNLKNILLKNSKKDDNEEKKNNAGETTASLIQ